MRYRWGFIDENENFTECFPLVDDGAAIDYSQQTGEVFYRAKLNGGLTFRFESFDDILAKGYNYEHRVELQWYDADNDTWGQVWRGRFALTDCEINYDLKTISVSPETLDRYTTILDKLEDEHNITKLAAKQQPVTIQIRPLCQFYALNDSKLVNYIGGNSWEASCDMTGASQIETDYHFRQIQENLAFWLQFKSIAPIAELSGKTILVSGTPDYSGTPRVFDMTGRYWDGSAYVTLTLRCQIVLYTDETHFALFWPSGGGWEGTPFINAVFERDEAGTSPAITIDRYLDDGNAQWDKIYCRMLLNVEGDTYHGEALYDLAADDMAGTNLNYNKISRIAPVGIQFYQYTQVEPTEWGLSYNDEYFIKPTGQLFPVGQGLWKYVSVWGTLLVPYTIFDDAVKNVRIRDCYMLDATAMRLLLKAGWTGQYWISRVLGGNNDYVGDAFIPVITPKSNVISSYYDSPAQNAPITLAKIFNLLKLAYKIYWYIDNNNNIHVEHISYFDNGYSYSEDEPELLVDLETDIHTNTRNNKVFGQNLVKFDKQDMPAQYTFGWGDVQTKTFDGFPLDMLDKYVSQGVTEEVMVGNFDTDVDFVLSSPNDVSKEGFFLFACPASGGVVSYAMTTEELTYVDEAGDTIEVSVQNADAAFVKIHQSYWRYHLPCENIRVTNEDTNAITTGSFKLQSVEFADVVMAEILKDISNCNKLVRTQQGDGHIKTLSINLNSLTSKADLLFNFVGRWYYLRGTALGASISITINGEQVTIEVADNKFKYKYREPITSLTFDAADVVSVDFGDTDRLAELTSCDNMFDGCEELLAVDFDSKDFSAVTSADYMFRGCVALTTLICPANSTWKADIDLSDCPSLTTDSLYQLIGFLYLYNSGVHTITPNTTMWNALDGDIQNDLIARATAKGWTIAIPAQYSLSGHSNGSTVYVTINGTALELPVTAGVWQYDYNAAITSISFEVDTNVTDIDFSLSDGLAGLTSLTDSFKDCSALTSVDFSNCDLSNVATASDAFANCTSLYELIIPSGTWKPDIDLSAGVMPKAEMLNVITGLYLYTSGTHTITFNSTIWDAMSVADQQIVFDAADVKGWETNAVPIVYVVRGTSSNVNGSETFNIQFILDGQLTPEAAETITVSVDGNGDWSFSYVGKKIYYLLNFAIGNTNITSVDFSNAESDELLYIGTQNPSVDWGAFSGCTALTSVSFAGLQLKKVIGANYAFYNCTALQNVDFSAATFESLQQASSMFENATNLTTINWGNSLNLAELEVVSNAANNGTGMFRNCKALTNQSIAAFASQTFPKLKTAQYMFAYCEGLTNIDLHSALFAQTNDTYIAAMFVGCKNVTSIDISATPYANMPTWYFDGIFQNCNALTTIKMNSSTWANAARTLNAFANCNALTTIELPSAATAIEPSSAANVAPMDMRNSPLTYTSMLNVANWLSDLTGQSAHTCTFKASAWNALSTAEQNNIDTILSGKNWNRAIA